MSITPTTRTGKGSELSWAELDANFTNIAAAINFLLPADVSFATAIPFNGNLYMPQQTVSSVLAFTVAASPVKGSHTYLRLVADGTNAPTFTGMKEWGGSAGYDNRSGIVNEIEFFYDGYDYWYYISQQVGATAVDTTAPTANSAAVANATPTIVNITMSESLDPAYVPAASSFAVYGHTVSSVAISGSTINVTVSAAFTYGEAARTVSYTQPGSNQARDAAGNLLASFSGLSITNNRATVPGAPTIGTATAGNASASVAFTAPASNGGAAITGYTVTSSPGGLTGTGSASPITVSGLTNGTAYTFTVTATNSEGTGASSSASNSVTPSAGATAPAQVTGLTLGTATSTTQTMTWTAPSNGGSAITDYVVQLSPAGANSWTTFADGTSTTTSTTVTGLMASTSYDYRVAAVNAIGQGSYSSTATGSTAAAGATYTTLNPSDKSADIALSGGNLTFSRTAGSGYASVRGVAGKTTGKWYFEGKLNSGTPFFGIGNASANLSSFAGATPDSAGLWMSGSNYWVAGSGQSTGLGTPAANDIICVKVDLDARTIAFRINGGSWSSNYNIESYVSGTVYPMMSVDQVGSGGTMNFGDTAFAQSVPSGFTGWSA